MAAVIGALASVPYYYRRIDDTVREHVESVFAKHYRDLRVCVKSAALMKGGIQVRGVSIVDPQLDEPCAELAHIDEVFLVCDTDLTKLAREMPKIAEIVVRRPTIRAARRADGTWSAAQLLPLPKLGTATPGVTIEGATFELHDPLQSPPSAIVARHGHFQILRQPPQPGTRDTATVFTITGHCTADDVRRIELDGSFDRDGRNWEFRGTVDGLDVGPELLHALPGEWSSRAPLLESLRGQAGGRFAIRRAGDDAPRYEYEVTGQLARGRLDDSRLPHPWTDLRADFRLTSAGFAITNLTANSGPATLRLDIERAGFADDAPMTVVAAARQLKLDRQLAEILPESMQERWNQLLPAGEVDLDAHLAFDGTQWTAPNLTVTCHNVAFTYHKFPYRLEHGTGQITMADDVLRVGLTAYANSEGVRLDGEIHHPGPDWRGFFQVRGNNLRVDHKLTQAIPEKPREIVESLNGHGTINLFVRYWRDGEGPLHNYMWIYLNRCDVRYDKFPYPLRNVRGIAECSDRHWSFDQLEGYNGAGRVQCTGQMVPSADGDVLTMKFVGKSLTLDEELRDALRPAARQLWNELHPTGAVNVAADVVFQTGWKDPHIRVVAEPLPDVVAIEPTAFPYRLEKLRGVFEYENGQVDIRGLRGQHGPNVTVAARGHCRVDEAGGWQLQLRDLHAGRLLPDRDLMQALPPRLKKAVSELKLSGPVTLRGDFDLVSTGRPGEPLRAGWGITADLQQVALNYAMPLENINGRLRLAGRFDGKQFWSTGDLDVDSMTFKNVQFTEVRGPLWIDDGRVLLGAAVKPAPGQRERSVTARSCGGQVVADGWVLLGPVPRYNLDATIAQAKLDQCAQELLGNRHSLTGDVTARVNLHGQGASSNQLGGWGHVQLREADIYSLPLMVSLLKIVSVKLPDSKAFSKSDIDFRLEGGHLFFSRIDFNGDAISLRGTGEMGLDKSLQLTFYTVVGRDEFRVPIVSEVLGGASQQLMAIYVEGPLDKPSVRKQPLPAVTEALQQMQAELEHMRGNRPQPAAASARLPGRPGAPARP